MLIIKLINWLMSAENAKVSAFVSAIVFFFLVNETVCCLCGWLKKKSNFFFRFLAKVYEAKAESEENEW